MEMGTKRATATPRRHGAIPYILTVAVASLTMFKKSIRGNPIIVLDGYRYCKNKELGLKTRWQCTNRKECCTASLPVFKKSTQGNPILVVDGYRYCKHRVSGLKTRWICPKLRTFCRAVLFTINDEVVTKKGVHNHPRTDD
ncbi:hypothetical protein ABMA27_001357 [Loxostege sticticalis]|uniref:FLYWCH-type domain-containing protein n=1 Tax=Loxostege sticticalis TaxID=481309 RepID=A0ABR3HY90_LOXSC